MRLYDYAASANCYKVRLLLAQLGREYERVPIDIFGGDTLTEDFGRRTRSARPLSSRPTTAATYRNRMRSSGTWRRERGSSLIIRSSRRTSSSGWFWSRPT